MPPTRGLSQEAKKASANILNYTHKTTVDNLVKNPNGDFLRVHDIKYNLTRAEITALRELRNNKNIIIKPADKGGAIVLMDKEKYMQVGLRQLTNPKYYREIPHTRGPETCIEINSVVRRLYNKGIIDDKQYAFLKATPPEKPRPFYLLPKVHKARGKWPGPLQPEGRPIVSDSGSETYNICKLIDYFLQPLSIRHPSYIKDTYDFLSKVQGLEVPHNALLVTGDVTALYTNMDIEKSIEAVKKIFLEFPPSTGLTRK